MSNIISIDFRGEYIEKYHRIFRDKYNEYLSKISKLIKELEGRRAYINRMIAEYKEGLFTLQLEAQSKNIEDDIYKICYNELSEEILRLTSELEDVEYLISEISSISDSIGEILNSIGKSISNLEVYKYEEEKI